MRDLAITVFIFGSLPFIFKRPWYGVMLYIWLSVMNPHRLSWDFAYNMPFAQVVALTTLVSLLISREPKQFPLTPLTVVLLLFTAWMSLTTPFALTANAVDMWEKVMKTMLMTFVALYALNSKRHIMVLIAVLTLSVGFYGIKGGWFTLVGGGMYKVYGPSGSFIEENNSLALAVIMTIPLLRFLHLQATNVWAKRGLILAMILCGFSALGSHSRGALVGIAAMLSLFWMKSRNKMIMLVLLAAIVPFAIAFMPDSWDQRMHSIENFQTDGSAMGRINAWQMAVNVALDRPFGGGFEMYTASTFARYAPNPADVHAAHSIYFGVLGEHGFFGLALFLLLGVLAYRDASWIISTASKHKDWQWAADLGRMAQVSIAGYAVGGAFLSLAYYDVPYYLMAAIVLTRKLVEKEVGEKPAPFFSARPAAALPRGAEGAPAAVPAPAGGRGAEPVTRGGGTPAVAEKAKARDVPPLMGMEEIKKGFGRG